ncbi:HD domain-containing protein [Candidatus Stoquefichus massiliensis]|uniref:HD domain-containing protein n=1 Tax=Candidatus Stoquefichus massiliensis TaxID=1470350 RepID=UPI00048190F4|nr:HD domain-containing protein [Candidatus Stoquefichus massiliensis]
MIDFQKARLAFRDYVSQYDENIPSIRLKLIHTYEVMKCSDYICEQLGLSQEDKELSALISLLHDIGRFEQWMRYESFADYKTIDHALFSSQLLFDEGLIRAFITDTQYDQIIKDAIEQHNKYKIDEGFDERTLLFIHLIRDADKLDNFRVKDEEDIETTLYVSLQQVNQETISPKIYDQFYHQQLIYGPTRITHLDMWLSYIAFIFDLHFPESLQYIKENNWVNRSFDRLHPIDEKTYQQYMILKQRALDYIG